MEEYYEKALIIEPIQEGENESEKIEEIESLLSATGASLFRTVVQRIKEITPATFVGIGKLAEIRQLVEENEVNVVIFDGELSPSQQNNISDAVDVKVITRTTLILDIFAMRANSPEGKILVELAQLKYLYPRLSGKGIQLSRLGGGIGTRGPGETQLETDRRHIKTRIKFLERNLAEIVKRRDMQRYRRVRNGVKTVALVGYTNTGKSTLMNLLCKSSVLEKDQLFATLDPTARKTVINGYEFVVFDTVGFVDNLPPALMEAFKSTLECAVYADLILNVCDISANWGMQNLSTMKTLSELGANAEIVTVANKCDKIESLENLPANFVYISAKNNAGIDKLNNVICEKLFGSLIKKTFKIDFHTKYNLTEIKRLARNVETIYSEDGVTFNIEVAECNYSKICDYFSNLQAQN